MPWKPVVDSYSSAPFLPLSFEESIRDQFYEAPFSAENFLDKILFPNFGQSPIQVCTTGANPTIASYNASVVNFYNATDSLACFENKIIFLYLKNALVYYNAGVVAVCYKFKSRRIGSRHRVT
jgi:hypothetical protein